MSRIFQLDFLFLNKKHKALISIGSDVREPYIHVQIIDSLFKLLFPTEHIRYRGIDGYKKLELYKDPFIKKLIDAIGVEVAKEMNGNYAKVKNLLSYLSTDIN